MYLHHAPKTVALVIALTALGGCRRPAAKPAVPSPSAAATAPATAPAGVQAGELNRYQYAQLHMGVQGRLVIYALDEETAERGATAAFRRVAELDQIASDYRPTSELNSLTRDAVEQPVKVSEDLFVMLERAHEVSRISEGAFDITVGPLVRLWREARKAKKLPSSEELDTARRLVGWRKVRLDRADRTVQLEVPGMQLDLGGLAKGYAADQVIALLRKHGIHSALFEFGGDIVVSDPPPGREGWMIRVVPEKEGDAGTIVPLKNCAISTSGDLEQFVIIDGRRYSHLLDPRTGIGTTDRALVTVIAPDGLTSDTLATAGAIMGQRALELEKAWPGVRITVRTASD
jgi:FAD:protein FMN transferase